MQENIFFDTNILLYIFLDAQDQVKHNTAAIFFWNTSGIISTQIINEVCVNILRKTSADENLIKKIISELFLKCKVIYPSESILIKASHLRVKYKFSFWDSLIVASALEAQANILYSEDMQHNLIIEKTLTIINPFIN